MMHSSFLPKLPFVCTTAKLQKGLVRCTKPLKRMASRRRLCSSFSCFAKFGSALVKAVRLEVRRFAQAP